MTVFEALRRDVIFSVRSLSKSRSLAWTGVATMGLGVAAVAIVFGVFDAVVLHAVPGPNGRRLVALSYTSESSGPMKSMLSHAAIDELATRHDAFDLVASWRRNTGVEWLHGPETTDLLGFSVSARFFDLFGVTPELGRTFRPDEDRPDQPGAVVLSDAFWRSQFTADSGVLGRTLTLNGRLFDVIGVMPADFLLPSANVQVWIPDTATAEEVARTAGDHFAIGRLRAGLTSTAAAEALARTPPQRALELGLDLQYAMTPLENQLVGPVGPVLRILLGAVGMVLAIACANVAILLLVHRSTRRRETAIHLALGASRASIVRRACVESLLVGVAGGSLGVALAELGVRLVTAIGPATIPRLSATAVNADVLAVAIACAVVGGVCAGVVPAIRSAGVNIDAFLDDTHAIAQGGFSVLSRHRGQALLALGQLVLVTILVVGSALLLRSLTRLLTIDLGMDTNKVVGVQIASRPDVPSQPVRRSQVDAEGLVRQLRAIPGVDSAAAMTLLPTGKGGFFITDFQAERLPGVWVSLPVVRYQHVTDDLFTVLRMHLVRGRSFSAGDEAGGRRVAVVSETFASIAWPGQDPLGKHIERSRSAEVIGVVGSARFDLGSASEPQVYYSWRQTRHQALALVVRYGEAAPSPLRPVLDYLKTALPGDRAVGAAGELGGIARRSVVEPRFYAVSLALFATLALGLAAVGVYGVSAHLVAMRKHEIGIRLALGAQKRHIRRLVWGASASLAVAGIVAGLAAAAAATRVLQGLLFEITPLDSWAFLTAPAVVGLATLIASWGPARSAERADPVSMLR